MYYRHSQTPQQSPERGKWLRPDIVLQEKEVATFQRLATGLEKNNCDSKNQNEWGNNQTGIQRYISTKTSITPFTCHILRL